MAASCRSQRRTLARSACHRPGRRPHPTGEFWLGSGLVQASPLMPRGGRRVSSSVFTPTLQEVEPARAASSAQPAAGPAFTAQHGPPYAGPVCFEGATSGFQLFSQTAARNGDRPCLGWQPSGTGAFQYLSFAQALLLVEQLASGLAACKLEQSSRLAVLAANSKEYLCTLLVSALSVSGHCRTL